MMIHSTILNKKKISTLTSVFFGLWIFLISTSAQAHKGPPFAIIIDEDIGPYLVSVWTDPDIGTGTFYVVFEPKTEGHPTDDIRSVRIGVQPKSGRLDEKVYTFEEQSARTGANYWTEVEFDKGEFYDLRVIIEGDGFEREMISEVEATPDGSVGPIGVLIYAIPFIGVGILWFRAIIVRRRGAEDSEEKEEDEKDKE